MADTIVRNCFSVKRDEVTGNVYINIYFNSLNKHRLSIQEYKDYLEEKLKYYDDHCDPYFKVSIQPNQIVRVEINSRECYFGSNDSNGGAIITISLLPEFMVFTLYVSESCGGEVGYRVHMEIDIRQRKIIL